MQAFLKLVTLYLLGTFSQNYAFKAISIYPSRAPSNIEYNIRRASASDYGVPSDNRFPRIQRGGDFKDLVTQSTVFADKSMFIKDVIEDESTALLIAMPRRWGKSVNLDMLKRFLEIPVGDDGEVIDEARRKATGNYQIFRVECATQSDGSKHQLAVSRSEITIQDPGNIFDTARTRALEVQGTRPVIYVDF
jgi:hypothetical protein